MLRFFVFSLCFSLFPLSGVAAEPPVVEASLEASPASEEESAPEVSEEATALDESAPEEDAALNEAPSAAEASDAAFVVDVGGYIRVGYSSMTPNRFL
ncbi:MAG: hypothetical protein VX699_08975, partial [Myxococcota bacterium]|nr:hypothetical protein [Myxococcota bacterium]